MFKVKIANNCEEQFHNSHIALKTKTYGNICPALVVNYKAFAALYQKEYNIVLSSGYLTFEREEQYTWFLMRWS